MAAAGLASIGPTGGMPGRCTSLSLLSALREDGYGSVADVPPTANSGPKLPSTAPRRAATVLPVSAATCGHACSAHAQRLRDVSSHGLPGLALVSLPLFADRGRWRWVPGQGVSGLAR